MQRNASLQKRSTPFSLGTFSSAAGAPFSGLVAGEQVVALPAARTALSSEQLELRGADSMSGILEQWEHNSPLLQRIADTLGTGSAPSGAVVSLSSLRVHAPVTPRQIFCSGANYKKHVVDIIVAQTRSETEHMSPDQRRAYGIGKMNERAASGTPYFFMKAPSALIGPYDPLEIPADLARVDWELELGVVIGRRARRVPRARALDYVAGYTIINDVTARERVNRRKDDVPEMGMNWVLSKSSPGFLPVGPFLVPAAFVGDPQSLRITLKLNGQTMQNESTEDMIFDVARLVADLSAAVELLPGDLICTGSPAGNGMHYGRFLRPGDLMEGSITQLGQQRTSCIAEGG